MHSLPLFVRLKGRPVILLGDGVVANVVLKQTKGHDSGWIVITTGSSAGFIFGD